MSNGLGNDGKRKGRKSFLRRLVSVVTSIVLAFGMVPSAAFAVQGGDGATGTQLVVASTAKSGTLAKNGSLPTCSWSIDSNWNLTIKPTSGSSGTLPSNSGNTPGFWPWHDYRASIKSVKVSGTVSVKGSAAEMFSACTNMTSASLSGLDTSQATNMSYLFSDCKKLTSLNLSSFNTANVTDMTCMFYGCEALKSLNVSSFNTSKVTTLLSTFRGCSALTALDVSNFNTSKVADMCGTFAECKQLQTLTLSRSLFNTAQVTDFSGMFRDCWALKSLDVSGFNTASATKMSNMFRHCKALGSIDVSGFNTANVTTSMSNMFYDCQSLTSLDLSSFNTMNTGPEVRQNPDNGYKEETYSAMQGFLGGCTKLVEVKLGRNFSFRGIGILPSNAFDCYTANWVGPETNPTTYAANTLRSSYAGSSMAGTYKRQKSLASALITSPNSSSSYTYTGSEIRPNVSVTLAGGSLPSDKNWTASWSSNVNVGTARVTLTGTGYCAGTVSTTFQITAANLSGASIASIADQTYTGSALAPTPTVTYGGRTLAAGADYTVSYSSNVNVGTATVTVTGNGNYTGTKSATFRIVAASSGDIAVSPIADQTYTGSAITPALTVTSGGRTLVPGTDYTASYSSNVNVGTATVAVTGMGNYSGSKSATFRIVAANIGGASVAQIPDQTYTGSAIAPEPTVTLGGRTLVSGNDYTVYYASNTDVGTATVTVTGNGNYTGTKSATFRIVAPTVATYTVSYDANGGVGTPSSQVKQEGMPLTLSSAQPAKAYTLSYNSCGGSVSPASKNVSCIFKGWNTDRSGSGTPYSSGGSYTADADATLYAQWENPVVGELAVPARSGYEFTGWFTSATGGTRVDALTVAVGNMTLFAQWADPYNLGDETYSFENYGDSDSPGGHCFGMSMTSAGYNNGLLDIARIGGNSNTPLYSFERTETVKQPICYYQKKQDHYRDDSTVAGGSYYLNFNKNMRENDKYDIASDWQSVVNYVKGHDYDNTGLLQIGFRKKGEGGHAINFLRYENVNGQDRIYAYDNNFPNQETYFYRNASGAVLEAPVQTFSGAIDCIALRDIRIYFDRVKGFDSSRVLYMAENAAIVQGFTYTYLEGSQSDSEYVMYEIPADKDKVTIIPKKSNADFIYMDTEYSFGEVTDGTRGELEFASSSEGVAGSGATFTIYEADSAIPNVTLSKTVYTYDGSVCKPSVAVEVDGASLRESRDYDVEYPAGMVDAGQYDVKVTLKGEYSGTIYKTFNIVKADQELTATAPASVAVGETARVVSDGKGAIAYSSNDESIATVTDEGVVEGIAPGKAVITVEAAGDDNYEAATTTVAIDVVDSAVKGANPMVAKGKTVKVKASSIKKKSAVIKTAKAFSVSKAQGKVTYKKVTGSKKVTVASNGKVTVKKGLKKGKHKIQVKVTAKGNAKWDAKSTLVTLTIKVV